jgi:hypothetical protein
MKTLLNFILAMIMLRGGLNAGETNVWKDAASNSTGDKIAQLMYCGNERKEGGRGAIYYDSGYKIRLVNRSDETRVISGTVTISYKDGEQNVTLVRPFRESVDGKKTLDLFESATWVNSVDITIDN